MPGSWYFLGFLAKFWELSKRVHIINYLQENGTEMYTNCRMAMNLYCNHIRFVNRYTDFFGAAYFKQYNFLKIYNNEFLYILNVIGLLFANSFSLV